MDQDKNKGKAAEGMNPQSALCPTEPELGVEKEVPDFEEFSLSKGCCSDDGEA